MRLKRGAAAVPLLSGVLFIHVFIALLLLSSNYALYVRRFSFLFTLTNLFAYNAFVFASRGGRTHNFSFISIFI